MHIKHQYLWSNITQLFFFFFFQKTESLKHFLSKKRQMWVKRVELKFGRTVQFIKKILALNALSLAYTYKINDRDSGSSLYWHLFVVCLRNHRYKFTYMSLRKVLVVIIFMGKNKHLQDHIFCVVTSVNAHINQIVKAVYSPCLDISSFWRVMSRRTRILETQFCHSRSLLFSSHLWFPR